MEEKEIDKNEKFDGTNENKLGINENNLNNLNSLNSFNSLNIKNNMNEKKVEFVPVKSWGDFVDKKSKLGEGSYGKVYKVEVKENKKEKALKIIPDKSDYLNEVDHLCRLNGIKGILPLEKVYIAKNKIGLLFPLGMDFEKWWKTRKVKHNENTISFLEDILCIIKCLLESVAEMHDKGVVHRDLSLSNLVFCASRPQIIDLGFSKRSFDCDLMECDYPLASPLFRSPELIDPEFFLEQESLKISESLLKKCLKNDSTNSSSKEDSKNENSSKMEIDNNDNDIDNIDDSDDSDDSDRDPHEYDGYRVEKESVEIIKKEVENNIDLKFVDWKKFYNKKDLGKMEWSRSGDKKIRVLYYNEKVDEWALGCIIYFILMNKLPFHASSQIKWFEFHQHYKNYYGKWVNNDYPKVFEKLPKSTREKKFDIWNNLKHKFSKLSKKIINQEEKKIFKLYGNWISLIIYDLLTPNPKKRPTCKEILFRVFESKSIIPSILSPNLSLNQNISINNFQQMEEITDNELINNHNDNDIQLTQLKGESILAILKIFYDKSKNEDCFAPVFYQTIFLWKNEFLSLSDQELISWFGHEKQTDYFSILWKSFYLCFHIISRYFYYLSYSPEKLKKNFPKLFYDIFNDKIKYLNQNRGITPINLANCTYWSIEQKLWNDKREKRFCKFLENYIKSNSKFPNQQILENVITNISK